MAAKMFREMEYKRFALEYDSELAGDFTPLQYLPEGKMVVLGLVTTKDSELESLDELKTKVLEAADIIAKVRSPCITLRLGLGHG